MKKYKTLIVDDSKAQQELLAELISTHSDIEICGTCSSSDEALKAIVLHNPELIFLDVEMPGKSGFELLQSISKISFHVIFTTAYAKYAVDAFKVAALDFLLKPVSHEAMNDALTKYRSRTTSENAAAQINNLLENLRNSETETQKLALPTSNGYIFVRIGDIIRCQGQDNYTTFFLVDKNQIVVSRTMKDCEEMLSSYQFQRIHQSHLIHMKYLKRYVKGDGGEVELDDGTRLEVSRRKKEDFLEALRRI